MIVIGGSSSAGLAGEIARDLGCRFIKADTSRFPDGECYTKLEGDAIDDDVAIVQNTYPDGGLVEMLLLRDAAVGMGAKRVAMVIPYFGYARQDRLFKPGEPTSAKVMCSVLDRFCDKVVTVDIHKESTLEGFSHPHKDLKAAACIAGHFRGKGIDLVLSPDIGAKDRAKDVGSRLGVPYDHLQKTRLSGTEVRIAPAEMDCKGKRVLIVDDMISTGGTIIAAASALKTAGASEVSVACTHGVFVGDAFSRLSSSELKEVLCCNTLEGPASKISVSKIIADELRRGFRCP
jgi:ribose-phosphate pyrophosphokinase